VKSYRLDEMTRGWFVGGFQPTAFSTQAVEVGVKRYKAGDREQAHFHRIATEITLILSGRVVMFEKEWSEGDIIVVEPNDATSFEALTDAVTVVVKAPGALNDKYLA
jgi:quercetin dioxygenase-like cupin family protein